MKIWPPNCVLLRIVIIVTRVLKTKNVFVVQISIAIYVYEVIMRI